MDPLKDRVGVFTEGILIMASPVLVAVALKKVNLRSEGNAAVRDSVSPLAALSLFLSSLAFILLGIASALKGCLPGIFSSPSELVFRFSKLLVHLCAIAQMLLAYMILLLIAMSSEAFVALLVVFGPFLFYCCYLSVIKSQEGSERDSIKYDKKLEQSLDFAAAVTSLLFLGLEGLAFEGQTGVGKDLDPRLLAPIQLTFVFCVMASAVMLLAAVPPIDYSEQQCNIMCAVLHVLCGALTLFFTAVVLTIVFVLEKEKGIPVAVIPCLCLFLFYNLCLCIPGGNDPIESDDDVTPASLEMTKVTFTGFLAITLPCFGVDSLSWYHHAFIISTAMSVLFGFAWRFLTHFKQKAAVWTAKVACLFTHVCLAAAVIPLMFMAMQALADANDECHIPCNPSPSARLQLFLFIDCFKQRAIETTSYTLSSVNC
ncbi:unnamed protein product [Urochloa decumbens]|uniref:Uncharacterized protein n=1 Tax=Urochloa decumbens TaxID=240449 RepID=A0ABC8Z728_9POAL